MFGHSVGRLVESDKRAVLGQGRGVQKAAPQRENLTCTVPSTHKARPHLTGCCVNIHSMMRSNRETDESAACFFLFSSSPLLARYRSVRSYNYKCQVQVCRFFSLSLIFPLLYLLPPVLLPPPCLLLSATSCGLEPFQMACLSCSVVLFGRFSSPSSSFLTD